MNPRHLPHRAGNLTSKQSPYDELR